MNEQVKEKTNELAEILRQSSEYDEFRCARQNAYSNEATKVLLKEYTALRTKLQLLETAGQLPEEELIKLQKLGELLQFDDCASRYLMAEYRLSHLMADVYETLANAVDIDLSRLDTSK